MERAEAREVGARFLQPDVARNNLDHVDAIQEILLEAVRDHCTGIRLIPEF